MHAQIKFHYPKISYSVNDFLVKMPYTSCFSGLNEMTVINGLIFLLVITGK